MPVWFKYITLTLTLTLLCVRIINVSTSVWRMEISVDRETPTRLVWNTNMADMTSCHDGPSHLTKQEPIGFWTNLMIGRKTNRFLLINSGFVITCEVPSQNQAFLLRRKKSRSSLFYNETRKARYFSRKNLHDIIVIECCWKLQSRGK